MSSATEREPAEALSEPTEAFVVLNPMGGTSDPELIRQALERHFAPAGRRYTIYETTGEEVLGAVVREAVAQGCNLVIAVGGDGTVSAVAEGLIHSDISLGIIPAGTANVLARELGVPVGIDEACQLLAGDYQVVQLDAMQVGERHYVLQIGIGLDALMIRDTEREAKRRFGRLSYVWTAFTRLAGYQHRRFTIVVDGERTRPRALQVLIANGGVLGTPPFRWGPDISPIDGRIDVCIVKARVFKDYLGLLWHTLIGQQRRNPNFRYLTARESVTVVADRPLPIQADGEIIGETPVQVRVVPGAVRVIVPKGSPVASE